MRIKKLMPLLIIILAFIAVNYWIFGEKDTSREVMEKIETENKVEKVEKLVPETPEVKDPVEPKIPMEVPEVKINPRAEEIQSLKEINNEVVGILSVPDTNIDYPVLQSKDNDFYLYRDIEKNKNRSGSIFMDFECIMEEDPNNLIIYGHNMKSKIMFSDLAKFKEKEYFDSHKDIFLFLPEETRVFKIIGGFVLDLTDESSFFQFNSFVKNDESMDTVKYLEEVKKRALNFRDIPYDTNSRVISLSTCSYESDNARFILVGVEENINRVGDI